ncbi:MAG: phospholipase C [Candidatus Binataceae bacterium]
MTRLTRIAIAAAILFFAASAPRAARAGSSTIHPISQDGNDGLNRVGHIIVLMQENHSFDNYFGALPYDHAAGYHPPARSGHPCDPMDHQCVDGLTCAAETHGDLKCANFNVDSSGRKIFAFHEREDCTYDPLHGWYEAHRDANFNDPNSPVMLNDGFVRMSPDDPTNTVMGYYTRAELPYYYALAAKFALDDRYFCAILGPTMPNRMYLMAGTSFGHILTARSEDIPPPGGYKPITGTLFDLLDRAHVRWTEYYQLPDDRFTPPRPYGALFLDYPSPHFRRIDDFYTDVAAGKLAPVVLIDLSRHEHPNLDIHGGEHEVARIVTALRRSSEWRNSILFLTYDENGGYYDHVAPVPAPAPDGIPPGACADRSHPPLSMVAGHGAKCAASIKAQEMMCAAAKPREMCANFDRTGFRVPLIAISPFARPHYVSHTVADHSSLTAYIERRFLHGEHLTYRDAEANPLSDMFDFSGAPSRDAEPPPVSLAPAASAKDPGCRNYPAYRRHEEISPPS